jgi:3-dehydroquinate synthase
MVVFQADMKFKIKSKIKNYYVEFISSYKKKILSLDKSYFFVIDKNVYNFFLKKKLKIKNFILINSTEKNKSYKQIEKILKLISQKKINKKTKIVAIGGGVIQDITGFVCSIYFRGLEWIYFPTTLLSQGDSCIGGKTSINLGSFKNQLGNFYPPSNIYIDQKFLEKLNKEEFFSGLGEITHLLSVRSEKNFNLIKSYFENKLTLKTIIIKSLLSKKYFIEKDEFDNNLRRLLNFGHTFGHAIESAKNYKIPHGICVAYGCLMAFWISNRLKYLNCNNYKKYEKIIKMIINKKINFNIQKFKNAILKDKKMHNNEINFILSKKCGKMFLKKIKINNKFLNNIKKFNSLKW